MRRFATTAFCLSLLALPSVVHAASGIISMTWRGSCTPIIQDVTPTSAPLSLVVSVLGNDETHSTYGVFFLVGSADNTVPDAWQFEATGCQGSSFVQIDHLPAPTLAKTCPAFSGTGQTLPIKDFSIVPPTTPFPTTLRRGVVVSAYQPIVTAVAAQRYFLAGFTFDHSFSVDGPTTPGVDCGGLATPMCIRLNPSGPGSGVVGTVSGPSAYVRASDGASVAFDMDGTNYLTTHGGSGCGATPATPTTWGAVKGQYRR